jgi:hypothetical protein
MTDLVTLSHALQIPVFIWAPEEEGQFQPGRCSRWWFQQSLQSLYQQIAALGSRLIVRRAVDSCQMLLQLSQETGAQAVFFNHLHDPISLVRDHSMKQQLSAAGGCKPRDVLTIMPRPLKCPCLQHLFSNTQMKFLMPAISKAYFSTSDRY